MAYKCFSVVILLLIISVGILSVFTAMKINQIQRLTGEIKKKDDDMLKMQKNNNVTRQLNEKFREREIPRNLTIHFLKSTQAEYDKNITKLNNQLAELQENESKIKMILKQTDILLILETLPIKIGENFGGIDGADFCDSSLPNFTYYHYLNGER